MTDQPLVKMSWIAIKFSESTCFARILIRYENYAICHFLAILSSMVTSTSPIARIFYAAPLGGGTTHRIAPHLGGVSPCRRYSSYYARSPADLPFSRDQRGYSHVKSLA